MLPPGLSVERPAGPPAVMVSIACTRTPRLRPHLDRLALGAQLDQSGFRNFRRHASILPVGYDIPCRFRAGLVEVEGYADGGADAAKLYGAEASAMPSELGLRDGVQLRGVHPGAIPSG
jgi:hypothetical protein